MKRQIWIFNHYAGSMFFEEGGRHYSFAEYLKQEGYNPVIFCANEKHGKAEVYFESQELWYEEQAEEIGIPFVFVKGRTYVGNGKERVLNMIDFYRNVKKVAKQYAKIHGNPDVIYASSVHPLTIVAGIQLAKYFGVQCVGEVRDLWPESIVVYSSRFTKSNPLIKLLYRGEKWIYKKCDKLIFTMEGGYDYIKEQGWDKVIPQEKVFHINNGVDLEVFDYNKENSQIEDEDLNNPDLFKVVYTGSIRRVNNLGLLLDVAKKVTNPKIKFLIWGDGDERRALEERVKTERILNVAFKGKVDKKYVPYIVSNSDLNLMDMQEKNELFRFGISPNKLFEYIAARRPILMYQLCEHNPTLDFKVGYAVDRKAEIVDCIERLSSGQAFQYEILEKNFLEASDAFSYRTLCERLIRVIEG